MLAMASTDYNVPLVVLKFIILVWCECSRAALDNGSLIFNLLTFCSTFMHYFYFRTVDSGKWKTCKDPQTETEKHKRSTQHHVNVRVTLIETTDCSVLGSYISLRCRCILHKVWHDNIIRTVFNWSPVLNQTHSRLSIAKPLTEWTVPLWTISVRIMETNVKEKRPATLNNQQK